MCADRGRPDKAERQDRENFLAAARMDRRRAKTLAEPKPFDAIPCGTCLKCGLRGRHAGPGECIAALRDRLADLE
jgi:hypothetical protein